jgi:hypothetical protein
MESTLKINEKAGASFAMLTLRKSQVCKNFRPKNNTPRNNFQVTFLLNIYHLIQAYNKKNFYIIIQNCVHFKRENFQNLFQKGK